MARFQINGLESDNMTALDPDLDFADNMTRASTR